RVKTNTFLAGNIMGLATLPLLQDVTSKDTVIMELSSWQLQGFHEAKISPHASIFTNIYPDHMNRYSGMEEYVSDKKAIYMYQKGHDFCLFNGNQEATRTLYESAPAEKYFFSYSDIPINLDLKIPGEHNVSNVAAVWRLANKLGIGDRIIREVVENFQGVEHRLESLGSKGGIRFVNDSTSTTPVAGIMALRSIKAENIFLIAGGADKKLDLKPFAEEASRRAQKIALLEGTATSALYSDLASLGAESKIVGIFDNLERAVLYLYNQASSGDVILLSPACASFGLFNNEFHRGDCFKSVVKGILLS
ncbi:MAG: UDP-N-acetylmuramoyl-L-alanine--D-glutamate ligase, partial [Desulfomonilaceae bacterium]